MPAFFMSDTWQLLLVKKRILSTVIFHGLHFKVAPRLPRNILGKKKALDLTLRL